MARARCWWLHGPPCTGKSSTAWELHADLLAGRPRAYFDVDQVGMCYPAPEDDPDRSTLKTRSARALVRRLAAAGAETVVVSGVLDRASVPVLLAEAAHGVDVTFCRVRVDPDELARRVRARYGDDVVGRVLDEAQADDDLRPGGLTVDAGAAPPREVAARALRLLEPARPAPGTPGTSLETDPVPPPGGAVAVLVCGPTGVGKSTAGFALFSALVEGGRPSSFLDLQQLGFVADVPALDDDQRGHQLTASCVAEVWHRHRAAGARTLVLNGHVRTREDVERYRTALGDVPLLVCRLAAGREVLRERIADRTRGGGPALAGDALVGASADDVRRTADRAVTEQRRLERADVADVVLDTGALAPRAVAERLGTLLEQFRDGNGAGRR